MDVDILIRGAQVFDGGAARPWRPTSPSMAIVSPPSGERRQPSPRVGSSTVAGWRRLRDSWTSPAIRKMTSDPCRRVGLADRGRLRPGYKADVVLFDPARVRDTAAYKDPIRYPEGIQTVLVNGVVTVEAGQHTGARAGQMVRRTGAR